jgi:hypothetical protein
MLKKSMHAAVIVRVRAERQRFRRRTKDHRRLVPDVVNHMMAVHAGSNDPAVPEQGENLNGRPGSVSGGDGLKLGLETRQSSGGAGFLCLAIELFQIIGLGGGKTLLRTSDRRQCRAEQAKKSRAHALAEWRVACL